MISRISGSSSAINILFPLVIFKLFRKISLTKPAIASLNVSYNIIKLLRQSIQKCNKYDLTIILNNKIASYLQRKFVFAYVIGESKTQRF